MVGMGAGRIGWNKVDFPLIVDGMDVIEDNTPEGWVASLAQSKAEVEAGKAVPLEPVLDRIRARIARMKARRQDVHPDA
jgi:hypothetical protein